MGVSKPWQFLPYWFTVFYVLSIVLTGYTLFTVEYFVGLELLRPIFLWMILSKTVPKVGKRILRVVLYWAPYILLVLLFLSWRISNETPRAKITIFERLSDNPGYPARDRQNCSARSRRS